MAAQIIDIQCAECGSKVDKLEFDPGQNDGIVDNLAAALNIDRDAALDLARENGSLPEQRARAYAQEIVDGPSESQQCPSGCAAGLVSVG